MMKTALELSDAIKSKDMSCVELMQKTLSQIDQVNPRINAIVNRVDPERALQQAKQADTDLASGNYRGWMHGFPHAVKDVANLAGFLTTLGSPLSQNWGVSQSDDIAIARIRKQGAIFIGKTNVPEFGLGSHTYNTVYGTTANAFDETLTAGGSSGGAAAALATGLLPVADGSDMMGSLRNPAGFNNVVGFRPSLGRIPVDNGSNDLFFGQLSSLGPMARTVADTAMLYRTMAGADRRAPLSMQPTPQHPLCHKPASADKIRIGWLSDYDGYLATEPGVISLCEIALKRLNDAGCTVSPAQITFSMEELWQSWLVSRQWVLGNGYRGLFQNTDNHEYIKPEALWEMSRGQNLSGQALYAASSSRSNWFRAVNKCFEQFDILALPAAQVFPFPKAQHWPEEINGTVMDTYHRWMEVVIGPSLCGCPVISLPAGFDCHGRAMGIQFMAPIGEDDKLLQFAMTYEAINPWAQHYADM